MKSYGFFWEITFLRRYGEYLSYQHACILSCFHHVQLFVTPWTLAHQAPLSMGILQARILEWVAMPSSRGSSWPRDPTHIPCASPALASRFFTAEPLEKPLRDCNCILMLCFFLFSFWLCDSSLFTLIWIAETKNYQ